MSIHLWRAKRITKRIEKLEKQKDKFLYYAKKTSEWIKGDKQELGKLLQSLSVEENIKYGFEMGFIDKTEYKVMNTKVRKWKG